MEVDQHKSDQLVIILKNRKQKETSHLHSK